MCFAELTVRLPSEDRVKRASATIVVLDSNPIRPHANRPAADSIESASTGHSDVLIDAVELERTVFIAVAIFDGEERAVHFDSVCTHDRIGVAVEGPVTDKLRVRRGVQ